MNQQENEYFNQLTQQRQSEYLALQNTGLIDTIISHIIDTYRDSAHFIYELIQNADDVKSTIIKIRIEKDYILFKHNGKIPFTITDPIVEREKNQTPGHINSITTFNLSTKKDSNSIGKFGIGFKSVYQYTNQPEIYNKNVNFLIKNYIIPEIINEPRFLTVEQDVTTIFYLPFSSNFKTKEESYSDTVEKLINLDNPLLFLRNVKSIEWAYSDKKGKFVKQIVSSVQRSEKITENKYNLDNREFLCFDKSLKDNLFISICFPLTNGLIKNTEEDLKITKYAYCFFPTKEVTNLNVIIHAPFILTPNREGIKENVNFNNELIIELSTFYSEILFFLKDQNLINEEFYWTLPYNSKDFLYNKFSPIHYKIMETLQKNDLIYTYDNRFIGKNSSFFLEGQALLKLIIDTKLLPLLTGDENAGIVFTSVTKNHESKYPFVKSIINKEIDPEMLIKLLTTDVLKELSFNTLVQIYLYLKGRPNIYELLKRTNIIIANDYEFYMPNQLYFPFDDNDFKFTNVRTIHRAIRLDDDLFYFFTKLGVKEYDLEQKVKIILDSFYYLEKLDESEIKNHLKHINLFLDLFESEPKTLLFKERKILIENNFYFLDGEILFVDDLFEKTYLKEFYFDDYYSGIEIIPSEVGKLGFYFPRYPINAIYKELTRKDLFLEFLKSLGVQTEISLNQIKFEHGINRYNKAFKELLKRKQTSKGRNIDYNINNICFAYYKKHDGLIEVSKKVWNLMCIVDDSFFKAIFKPSISLSKIEIHSTILITLKDLSWIPIKSGEFKKPFDCSRDELLEGFPYNDTNGWLTLVEFGKGAEKKSEIYKQDIEYATKYNTKPEILDEFKNFTIEEQEEMVKEAKRKKDKELLGYNEDDEYIDVFPEGESSNPTGREIKVKTLYDEAEEIIYEERKRRVRIKNYNGKIIKENLKNFYHSFGKIYCQICEEPMTIKYNGNYYYEAVQIFDTAIIKKENEINYLCLCSSCSDLFSLAKNDIDFNKLKDRILNVNLDTIMEGIRVELDVKNDKNFKVEPAPKTIRFVEKHLRDIQSILKSEDK